MTMDQPGQDLTYLGYAGLPDHLGGGAPTPLWPYGSRR